MHEKKAKEKEKRLLEQEKQLYQARVRSQIRTKLFDKADPGGTRPDSETNQHKPMSPDEHVKALADRFMKEGAEDLWNEDDGPVKSEQRPRSGAEANQRPRLVGAPVDLRSLISDKRNSVSNSGNVNSSNNVKTRNYSVLSESKLSDRSKSGSLILTRNVVCNGGETVISSRNVMDFMRRAYYSGTDKRNFRRNDSSSTGDKAGFDTGNKVKAFAHNLGTNRGNGDLKNMSEYMKNMSEYMKKKGFVAKRRFKRNESSSSDDDSDIDSEDADEKVEGWRDVRKMGSSASLGKYDMKITKRVPLKSLEDEHDFEEEVELIRKEISKNKLVGNGEQKEKREEEPILSQKRFDECGISPLTIKALTAAGYIQMTRVQEATLSVCLEGKDAVVKAKTGTGKSVAFLFGRLLVAVPLNGCHLYMFLFSVPQES